MAKVTITEQYLEDIADAIRSKSSSSTTYTPSQMAAAILAIPTGSTVNNQNKAVTPNETEQSITFDSGYTGLGTVTVGAISSTYVGSGIARNDSSDLIVSAPHVGVPAGYYAEEAIGSINIGSATGPTSLSGSSATVSTGTNTITLTKTGITTTPTVSAGYVSRATSSTATVALTASVAVNPTPTASGKTVTIPAGYYTAQTTKDVASGVVTAPNTVVGGSATVQTGTNTITFLKTVSVTPLVTTAGYVSSGTAGDCTVELSANIFTKAATTYHPSTTARSISSGTYLTGAQTISAVTTSNLSASNIVSGVTIKVGDSSDDDCVASVTGNVVLQNYYTGSSEPSASLGNNGDLYLKV